MKKRNKDSYQFSWEEWYLIWTFRNQNENCQKWLINYEFTQVHPKFTASSSQGIKGYSKSSHKIFSRHILWRSRMIVMAVILSCVYPGYPRIILCGFLFLPSLCTLATTRVPREPIRFFPFMIYDSKHALCCFTCCFVLQINCQNSN